MMRGLGYGDELSRAKDLVVPGSNPGQPTIFSHRGFHNTFIAGEKFAGWRGHRSWVTPGLVRSRKLSRFRRPEY